MYYLQSRYYDPALGRFINADSFASTGQGILGCNMFAYCGNNPVVCSDPSGQREMIDNNDIQCAVVVFYIVLLPSLFAAGPVGQPASEALYRVYAELYDGVRRILRNLAEATDFEIPVVFEKKEPEIPDVDYPGDDPAKAPEGTEWRGKGDPGSGDGNYYDPKTGKSYHPDLDHPDPIGPHWDFNYRGSGCNGWRIFSDGRIVAKFFVQYY